MADFFGTPLSGEPPLSVAFTDTSTNTPTGWAWTFGDGGTSAAQNPVHTYGAAGVYNVSLTAANAGGSDGETKTGYITVAVPAETLLSSRRLGNQIALPIDWSPDALTVDLMKRGRNLSPPTGTGQYKFASAEHSGLIVQSLTRISGVTHVVLASAPEAFLISGMKQVLQLSTDSSFDTPDGAAMTVSDQTHYSYVNPGPDATAVIPSRYDCPAAVINTVACGADGNPIEDFYTYLISRAGLTDLAGTYTVHFPGSVPSSVTFPGASLSGSGATRTLVITTTGSVVMNCTGVAGDGSFKLPTIIRNDHASAGTLVRPDFANILSRWGVHRDMDAGDTNYNAHTQGWGSRPLISLGRGLCLEDRVRLCNEAGCDMYFVLPTMATDDYVTNALTYIRDNLTAGLKVYIEVSNEVWNSYTFPHFHWILGMLRKRTKAVYHGSISDEVVSITRSGSTVSVLLNRAPPFTSGTNVWMKVFAGSAGYDTAAGGATATVSGNTFSFTNTGSASGAASYTDVCIFGDTTSPLVSGADGNLDSTMVLRMLALRTYEVAQIASTVFGGLGARARPVLMWQHVQFGTVRTDTLPWLQAQFGPVKNWLWAIGGAPYSKADGAHDTTPAEVRDSLIAYCDSTCDDWQHYIRFTATKYGLHLINYEGGFDFTEFKDANSKQTLLDSLYSAPEMRTASKHLIDHAFGFGADLSLQLNSSMSPAGTPGDTLWGIGRSLAADGGDIGSATCQKLKGIDDALLLPPPPVIDPNQLPGTLFAIGGSTYKDEKAGYQTINGMLRLYDNANSFQDWVFYADGTTAIALTLWGRIVIGSGGNGARLYLDGTLAGTANLQTTTGDLTNGPSGGLAATNVVTITPAEGWHILTVRPPASQPDHVGFSKVVGAAV